MDQVSIDILWIAICSGLVFLMQGGFLCLEAGLTRSKNAINVAIKNLFDAIISIFLFWLFSYGLMFGTSIDGVIGSDHFAPRAFEPSLMAFFFFQSLFCATAVTIVSGAVAERMKFSGYVVVAILISGLIYPVFGHFAWNGLELGQSYGFLGRQGFVDFAGATVVHGVGGWVALAALLIIGPRTGRFMADGTVRKFTGHQLPLAALGVILLWLGWFGFNGGSVLAFNDQVPKVLINTMLGAVSGGLVMAACGWIFSKRMMVSFPMNGVLAGLVAVTAGCHAIDFLQAVLIGGIGAIIALVVEVLLERNQIDDVISAVPVHLAAGIWGTLAVALFGDLQILDTGLSRWQQTLVQSKGIFVCFVWSFGLSYIILKIFNRYQKIRVTAQEEQDGLNASEHGASTELYDLFSVMAEQEESGDMGLRVPEEPFTEVGLIGKKYNQVMESLEQKKQEAEKTQEQLKKSYKMSSLGEMVSGIAHEIRNPLAGILGYSPMLLSSIQKSDIDPPLKDKLDKYADQIRKSGIRIEKIIDGLRTFSRNGDKDPFVSTPIKSIVDDAAEICVSRLKKTQVALEIEPPQESLTCECRASQICQVLVNLINNGSDAVEALNEKWVKVTWKDQGDHICLCVVDSGSGIPQELQDKIFGSFFTTKEIGKGTGLGLSLSKGIIEEHQGTFSIDNQNPHTCFVITLPKVQKKAL